MEIAAIGCAAMTGLAKGTATCAAYGGIVGAGVGAAEGGWCGWRMANSVGGRTHGDDDEPPAIAEEGDGPGGGGSEAEPVVEEAHMGGIPELVETNRDASDGGGTDPQDHLRGDGDVPRSGEDGGEAGEAKGEGDERANVGKGDGDSDADRDGDGDGGEKSLGASASDPCADRNAGEVGLLDGALWVGGGAVIGAGLGYAQGFARGAILPAEVFLYIVRCALAVVGSAASLLASAASLPLRTVLTLLPATVRATRPTRVTACLWRCRGSGAARPTPRRCARARNS